MNQAFLFEDLTRIEAKNLEYSKNYLGNSFALIHDFLSLYELFLQLAQKPIFNICDVNQIPAITHLLQLLRNEGISGSLVLLKGRITDSSSHTRKSIEVCAFIAEMFGNPDSAKRWMEAGLSEGALKRYRSRFPGWQLVSALLNKPLIDSYEQHCLCVHPSFFSLVKRAQFQEDGRHTFNVFELEPDGDQTYMVMQFFMLMETHGQILSFLSTVFNKDGLFDGAKWQAHFVPFVDHWKDHRDRIWRPLIDQHFEKMQTSR